MRPPRRSMHVTVIRVREHGSVAIPITLMLVHLVTKHGKNRGVIMFHLLTGLGVIRTRECSAMPYN